MTDRPSIFDCHTHVGDASVQYQGRNLDIFKFHPAQTLEDKQAYMSKYDIDNLLLIPFYSQDPLAPYLQTNQVILRAVEQDHRMCGALWFTPNVSEREHVDAVLSEARKNPGVVALKTTVARWDNGYTADPKGWDSEFRSGADHIFSVCADLNIPVHFHCAFGRTGPSHYEGFVGAYPKVKLHLVHMGMNVLPHFEFVPLFLKWVSEGASVYCDTSLACGFAVRWLVEELLDRKLGVDQVMFATDEPWGMFPSEYHKIAGLDVDAEVKHQLLYGNAAKLYARRTK